MVSILAGRTGGLKPCAADQALSPVQKSMNFPVFGGREHGMIPNELYTRETWEALILTGLLAISDGDPQLIASCTSGIINDS